MSGCPGQKGWGGGLLEEDRAGVGLPCCPGVLDRGSPNPHCRGCLLAHCRWWRAVQSFPKRGGGVQGGRGWGGTLPPSGDPKLLEAPNKFFSLNCLAPKAPEKNFDWPMARRKIAQSLRGEGGGQTPTTRPPKEMLSC